MCRPATDLPTPGWGYGYGQGWINPTRTRTLLAPAAVPGRVQQPVNANQSALKGGSSKSKRVQEIMVVCVKGFSVYVTCVTLHKISNFRYQTISRLIISSQLKY